MEWNINSDKISFEWISSRTPPSCILVNIILMEMATNPNSEVSKMIPCIKYINNMRIALSLLASCLVGKDIGNSIQVNQLHSYATIHKGKQIMIVVLSVLTNNKKLRTICLAGDITPKVNTS